jgi:pimeloyl-ACP methyl ester carboxylesterase
MDQLPASSIFNDLQVSNEKYISLSDGRQLAYTEQGDTNSDQIIIFFHGAFGIGDFSDDKKLYKEIGYHFIAPTLPGWGNSSPWPENQPILNYPNDIHQLLSSLKKNDNKNLRITVAGGSYGSVFAQICFSTSTDIMPEINNVQSLIVLSGFSPFKYHNTYTTGMSWTNYFAVGMPAIYFPSITKLVGLYIQKKIHNIEEAKVFLRNKIFDQMDDEEKDKLRKWEEERNKPPGWVIEMMSRNMCISISKTMAGFHAIPKVIHSDWGFDPKTLPTSPKRKVLIIAAKGDKLAHMEMSTYLVESYPNAEIQILNGGHLAAFYELDEIMKNWLTNLDKEFNDRTQMNE